MAALFEPKKNWVQKVVSMVTCSIINIIMRGILGGASPKTGAYSGGLY